MREETGKLPILHCRPTRMAASRMLLCVGTFPHADHDHVLDVGVAAWMAKQRE
jgi:hypothetical protein